MSVDQSLPQPRRWKFSLSTMLLVVGIVCLAIPLVLQSRQLRDAQAELRQLRDETGRLTIEDRSKVHVMLISKSADPPAWKWRLFIPKGARYGWSLAQGEIPTKDLPKPTKNAFWNGPYDEQDNEVLVTAVLRKREDGDWDLSVTSRIGDSEHQMGGTSIKVPDAIVQRVHEGGCIIGDELGSQTTKLLNRGEAIVLLRHRGCEKLPNGEYANTGNPTPGYIIWMTPW